MIKKITLALVLFVAGNTLYADGFQKRYQMMDTRIHSKMDKFKGNAEAQKFLEAKLACVKASKTEGDLKACKKKHSPKELKAIVSK